MIHLHRLACIAALVVSSTAARADDAEQLLPPRAMRADLAYLRAKILAQHPHPFLYTSRSRFDRLYRQIDQDLATPQTRLEFYRRTASLAASLKDGHTLVNPLIEDFRAFAQSSPVLPLRVAFVGDRLFVRTNESGDAALSPGTEVLAIDGRPVATLVAEFGTLIDDVHPLYDVDARLFRELYWLKYGSASMYRIDYRTAEGHLGMARVAGHVYSADGFSSYAPSNSRYAFRMIDGGIGLLTLDSFTPSSGFDDFLERTFATLDETGSKALIIDVRRNGGGSGRLAQQVVSYLTDKPYAQIGAFLVKVTDDLKDLYAAGTTHTDADTRDIVMGNPAGSLVDGLRESGPLMATPAHRDHVFRGTTILLTANNTFSAAAMFTAYLKCNRLASVVGEEPGQATNFVTDAVPFTMPNSGLTFGVSFSEIHMPCEQSYFHGIAPDLRSSPSPQGLGAGRDEVLQVAIEQVRALQR